MKITIFTPTYNRRDYLKKCYESLYKQTNMDFKWLLIDDGSTDGTYDYIQSIISSSPFEIKYIKKENGGKHTAYNLAVDICDTEYIAVALDSDDGLKENAVETIYNYIKKITDDYVGIVFRKETNDEVVKVKYDINTLKDNSLSYISKNNLLNVECMFVFKTDYIKNYKYPVLNNEKFFTEAFTYYQLDKKMIWTNDYIYYGDYLEDGLTKNTYKLFVKYPLSWKYYNKLRMRLNNSRFLRLKYFVYYLMFSMLSKSSIFGGLSFFERVKAFFLIPLAFLLKIVVKYKGEKK